jgi:hypothetical protein
LFDRIYEPFRFLCNSNTLIDEEVGLNWCALDMAGPTEQMKEALKKIAADGKYIMELDKPSVFALGDSAAQKKMDEWDKVMLEKKRKVLVPDPALGAEEQKVSVRKWLRDELYHSTDKTVTSTDELCKEALEAFAVEALKEIEKIAKDYLSGGKYSAGSADELMRRIMAGTCRVNDAAERMFGKSDQLKRATPGIHLSNVGAVVACESMKLFGANGKCSKLHPYVLEALMYMVTHDQGWYQSAHEATREESSLHTQLQRAERKNKALEQLEIKYEKALRYHKKKSDLPTTKAQLEALVKGLSGNQTTEAYKDQVRHRVLGNGWRDFNIAWSKNGVATPDAVLKQHLLDMYKKETKLKWPTDPPIPGSLCCEVPFVLGTPTDDRTQADEDKQQLGLSIAVKVNDPSYVSLKPKKKARSWQNAIPVVDQSLVGRVVEYCFSDNLWYEGLVLEVSNGTTAYAPLKNTGQKKAKKHGVRWVHIKFDLGGRPDSENWHHLRASHTYYNPKTDFPGGWRMGAIGETLEFSMVAEGRVGGGGGGGGGE